MIIAPSRAPAIRYTISIKSKNNIITPPIDYGTIIIPIDNNDSKLYFINVYRSL